MGELTNIMTAAGIKPDILTSEAQDRLAAAIKKRWCDESAECAPWKHMFTIPPKPDPLDIFLNGPEMRLALFAGEGDRLVQRFFDIRCYGNLCDVEQKWETFVRAWRPKVVKAGVGGCGGSEISGSTDMIKTEVGGSGFVIKVDDCTEYPPGKILGEVKIVYASGINELPGERQRAQEILASIDYRFTQGITRVEINEEGNTSLCPINGFTNGYYIPDSFGVEPGATIGLCRDPDGTAGAFASDDTLRETIYNMAGKHVAYKNADKVSEYYITLQSIDPEAIPVEFEIVFSQYILYSNTFRLQAENNFMMKKTYEWLRDNIFCGKEYGESFIDPSQCDMHPPNSHPTSKIVEEVTLSYGLPSDYVRWIGIEGMKDQVEEIPGEREMILSHFSAMDYRFVQGIKDLYVIEYVDGICHSLDGKEGSHTNAWYNPLSSSPNAERPSITICRGIGGAIDYEDPYFDKWFEFVIHHETGHHVEEKTNKDTFAEYEAMKRSLSSTALIDESFANGFASYQLHGISGFVFGWEKALEPGTPSVNTCLKYLPEYYWLKENIFCGVEFPASNVDNYREIGDYYLETIGDCNQALQEYQKYLEKADDADPLRPSGYIGIARSLSCLGNCNEALAMLEPHATTYYGARFYLAETHETCIGDIETALSEYQAVASDPEGSQYDKISSLYRIARIYKEELGDCQQAVAAIETLFNDYPNADQYLEVGPCQPKDNTLEKAQEIIENCMTP